MRNNTYKNFVKAKLPDGYLDSGYYDDKNKKKIKPALVNIQADFIAKLISDKRKLGRDYPIKKNQLRKFYDYTINLDEKLKLCKNLDLIEVDIDKLKLFARDAKSKGNVPTVFVDFIDKNVESIKDAKDFKAFVEHFQAIVAYFSYYSNGR